MAREEEILMTMNNKPTLIKGGGIYTDKGLIKEGFIRIEGTQIAEIGEICDLTTSEKKSKVITIPSSYKVIPGFIDSHIHGVENADTMDATIESLYKMARALPKEGTTSFLATTITQDRSSIEKALVNVKGFISDHQTGGMAEILGVHLEGPFVNRKMAGAQPKGYIVDPNMEDIKRWIDLSGNNIKVVTLAPEQNCGLEMIGFLKSQEIVASIGHSDATYTQVLEAMEAGVRNVTHLFNQMRGVHHREPGVVGAALLHDDLKAEIIVDGIHVHPQIVKLAYQSKGRDGLILISDSMRAKWLEDGHYDLGGQLVTVNNGKAVLKNGTLAGSVLKLSDAVKNILKFTGCSLEDAIVMASVNPAKQLGIYNEKGSLTIGKDADLVIFDDDFNVVMTLCRGIPAYTRVDLGGGSIYEDN